jgi:hypothetical protein
MSLRRSIAITITVAVMHAALAAPTPAPVRTEIDALLARLESSGCEFYRNGTWYDAEKAKAHLLMKLRYLEAGQTLESTEQFIELAATASSLSGQPYEVRCAGGPPMPSAQWLGAELVELRSAAIAE